MDDVTRQARHLQEGLHRRTEDIKVELRRPQPLVFDEEEKLGGYYSCPVLALADFSKSVQIVLLSYSFIIQVGTSSLLGKLLPHILNMQIL